MFIIELHHIGFGGLFNKIEDALPRATLSRDGLELQLNMIYMRLDGAGCDGQSRGNFVGPACMKKTGHNIDLPIRKPDAINVG